MREKDPAQALSPELRKEVQSIVRSTIDRAIAPLIDKQKKLEQALEAARDELEAERQRLAVAPRPAPAIPPPLPPRIEPAVDSIPVFVEEEITAAPQPETSDVPWELDGSRRRRLVAWIFATLLVLALGAATTAAMLSQAGYKI